MEPVHKELLPLPGAWEDVESPPHLMAGLSGDLSPTTPEPQHGPHKSFLPCSPGTPAQKQGWSCTLVMFKGVLVKLTIWGGCVGPEQGDGFGAVGPEGQEHPGIKQQLSGNSFPSGQLRHGDLSWTTDFVSPGKVLETPWLLSGLRCGDLIKSHGAYSGLGFTQRTHFHPKGTFLPEASRSRACLPYGAAGSSWEEGCGELPQFHLCNFFSKVRRSRGRRNGEDD